MKKLIFGLICFVIALVLGLGAAGLTAQSHSPPKIKVLKFTPCEGVIKQGRAAVGSRKGKENQRRKETTQAKEFPALPFIFDEPHYVKRE